MKIIISCFTGALTSLIVFSIGKHFIGRDETYFFSGWFGALVYAATWDLIDTIEKNK